MDSKSSIILIEEDNDDVVLIADIFRDLDIQHELRSFATVDEAFKHIKSNADKPFLVICNNNYRNGNHEHFKSQLEAFPENRIKSIPFIFYSTTTDDQMVTNAFDQLSIQGFFKKASSYEQMKADLKIIIEYWERSKHPHVNV